MASLPPHNDNTLPLSPDAAEEVVTALLTTLHASRHVPTFLQPGKRVWVVLDAGSKVETGWVVEKVTWGFTASGAKGPKVVAWVDVRRAEATDKRLVIGQVEHVVPQQVHAIESHARTFAEKWRKQAMGRARKQALRASARADGVG